MASQGVSSLIESGSTDKDLLESFKKEWAVVLNPKCTVAQLK